MGQLGPCATTTEARSRPRTRALQLEKPLQWELRAPQLENSRSSPQLEKACTEQRRPSIAKTKLTDRLKTLQSMQEKKLDKTQHPFMIKNAWQIRTSSSWHLRREHPSLPLKSTANMFYGKRLKAFPSRSGTKMKSFTLATSIQHCTVGSSQGIQARMSLEWVSEWTDGIQIGKKEVKLPLSADHMISHSENPNRTSLVVWWLRFHAPKAGALGSISGWESKTPQTVWCGQKRTNLQRMKHWYMLWNEHTWNLKTLC